MTETNTGRTLQDYYREHLKHGPDSTILEYDRDYFETMYGNGPIAEDFRNFRNHIGADLLSCSYYYAASSAMDVYRAPLYEFNHFRSDYKKVERIYEEAATLAIKAFSDNPEVKVEELPISTDYYDITKEELIEVSRLALQYFKVFRSLVETGEVPEEV